MPSDQYIQYVRDLLAPFGPLIFKKMFGGYGIYKSQLIIALVVDNELYFKANLAAAEYFRSCGCAPFTYERIGKLISLPYWRLLPEILENQELLEKYFILAAASATQPKKKSTYKQKINPLN
jgi:DNA transformation protein